MLRILGCKYNELQLSKTFVRPTSAQKLIKFRTHFRFGKKILLSRSRNTCAEMSQQKQDLGEVPGYSFTYVLNIWWGHESSQDIQESVLKSCSKIFIIFRIVSPRAFINLSSHLSCTMQTYMKNTTFHQKMWLWGQVKLTLWRNWGETVSLTPNSSL